MNRPPYAVTRRDVHNPDWAQRVADTELRPCMATADEEEVLEHHSPVDVDAGVLVCDLTFDHEGDHWDEHEEMAWGLDL